MCGGGYILEVRLIFFYFLINLQSALPTHSLAFGLGTTYGSSYTLISYLFVLPYTSYRRIKVCNGQSSFRASILS
jgi:hypothetical protein